MCTAYEVSGKARGSDPGFLDAAAVAQLILEEQRIIRPTIPAPVIMPDGSLRNMIWGFRRSFAPKVKGGKPVTRSIVNSREDKLDGNTWKKAFAERRCLVPASSFYEWVELNGRNLPLQFRRPGDEWIWIAGIWEEDERGECFSMITTEPNDVLEPVHDRMPAVLGDEQIRPYLDGDLREFGPSRVPLVYEEGENFLRKKKKSEPPRQGELF